MAGLAWLALACSVWAYEPTKSYERRQIHGWLVLFSADYDKVPSERREMEGYVRNQLQGIVRRLPRPALAKLRKVVLWVEYVPTNDHGAAYHPDASWLHEQGMNPAKAKGVELGFNDFLDRVEQPAIVLHELAHAYHNQVLGDDHPKVLAAYRAARRSPVYRRARDVYGGKRRHYGLNDEFEYFAEATEAYFLRNDFAPFTRAALRKADPQGYVMIETLWGVSAP